MHCITEYISVLQKYELLCMSLSACRVIVRMLKTPSTFQSHTSNMQILSIPTFTLSCSATLFSIADTCVTIIKSHQMPPFLHHVRTRYQKLNYPFYPIRQISIPQPKCKLPYIDSHQHKLFNRSNQIFNPQCAESSLVQLKKRRHQHTNNLWVMVGRSPF